jgi:enamine deaminase RidA (YjgF/YER057c/UK114 family)
LELIHRFLLTPKSNMLNSNKSLSLAINLKTDQLRTYAMTHDDRFAQLHLQLPNPAKPVAKYKMAVITGKLMFLSGHGPARINPNTPVQGKVGAELTLEQGKESARAVALNMLATLKDQLGSLNKIKRLVKTLALVNCSPDFGDQPKVVNGFSELMAEVFGEENGVGARSAMGTNSLPGNMPVEVECIFELE